MLSFFIFFQLCILPLQAQENRCSTVELQNANAIINSNEKHNIDFFEELIQKELKYKKIAIVPNPIITIPVVVHVIYHKSSENISDEQIKSQIDVLNEDYSGINATTLDIQSLAWQNLNKDTRIRFKLAEQDPNGNYTTGVTKTFTITESFSYTDTSIFYDISGGKSAWPNTSYLNLWVCTLADNVLGFAALPGSDSYRDGVVINNIALGRKGIAKSPYNYGRTSTHEIGHWLSMRHIWGDDNGACSFDDGIADTPKQADSHFRCPGFPALDNCTAVSPGVMYMNYMDYTDDKCMMFFTPDQASKMYTALDIDRSSIKSSLGLIPLNGISNDISIDSIFSPVTIASNRCFNPIVRLKNNGNSSLNNIKIRFSVNGGIEKKYFYTDTIFTQSIALVQLPTISGQLGSNVFEVSINFSDINSINNYCSSSFKVNSAVNLNCENSNLIVYPNPVYGDNSITVKTSFIQSQQFTVRLFNLLGQSLFEEVLNINPSDEFSIPLQGLNSSVYVVQLEGAIDNESVKFIYINN